MKTKKTGLLKPEAIDKLLKTSEEFGYRNGELDEALNSLRRRFTENELRQIVQIVWFSDLMQSIRTRLKDLERAKK